MRKIISLSLLSLCSLAAFAASDVYRWKDSNGLWHYSDQPQPGAELVRGSRRAPAARNNTPASPVEQGPRTLTTTNTLPVSKEVATEVRQEAAKAKADQCKKADTAYQQAVQARRVYKEDAKGNRTFLSEPEIDAARLEARSARDLACK
jgi:Domain of unknown function (DUF4124)